MSNSEPYEIMTGVGKLYRAAAGTTFPVVNAIPDGNWTDLGETDGGVSIALEQTTVRLTSDQKIGPIKAVRSAETLTITTNLNESTLENLAVILGKTVTDTAPGVGTIGTREMTLKRGQAITPYAWLFRGENQSPYGDFPAQFEVPYGYVDGNTTMAYTKDGKVVLALQIVALEDPNAATEADRFGKLIVQDAAAT